MDVSIIITAYNYDKYIERCIRSCLDQNFLKEKYEIIIVDDNSTDKTEFIVAKYSKDKRIVYIKSEDNVGVAQSSNIGITAAKGRFVVRVDADDYVNENFIYFLSEYLKNNHDSFCVSCDYWYVDNNGNKIERLYAELKPVSCGIMYRRDILIEMGMYNPDWRHREEEELRKRLKGYYQIHHLRIPLYRYRMHANNKTKQKDYMEEFKNRLLTIQRSDKPEINYESDAENYEDLKKYTVVVIPARGGSKRLKRKNIHEIWGKPMISWAINAALNSKMINDVFVSTEDKKIKSVSKKYGAKVIDRPKELSEDRVYKQDVIRHAVNIISENEQKPTIVVSLQSNSPQVQSSDIEKCINHLIEYNKHEVMSVDDNLNGNAAIRVMVYNTVFQKTLSTRFGVVKLNLRDVHNLEDVEFLEKYSEK